MTKKLLFSTIFLLLSAWVSAQNLTINMSTTPACSLDGTASVTVSGGVPPYSYQWYWGNNQSLNTTSNTLTGLPGGWISVQVTDANNATGFGWGTSQPPFTLNNTTVPDTCGQSVGSASVTVSGGTPPYTYLWSTGATTSSVSNLAAGQYEVTVHDANNCAYATDWGDSSGVFVWSYSPITINTSTTPSSCNDGTATANPSNGVAPYSYYWFDPYNNTVPIQTGQTATNLSVGSHVVRVTDANGCTSERWVYVSQGTPPFTVSFTKTNELCTSANGSITLSPSGAGPYTYNWSNGATTSSISGLSRGNYRVTVTDPNGCPVTKSINIFRSSPMNLNLTGTNPGCGLSNGSVTANPTNGTPPYTYLWSNGATTQSISGLPDGYYHVQVTDANGCTASRWEHLTYASSCYGVISGTVRQDNSGCTPAPSNPGLNQVFLSDGNTWTSTDAAGDYAFWNLPGTYTISNNGALYHNQSCPGAPGTISATVASAGAVSQNNDFYLAPLVPVQDLRVSLYCDRARPGFMERVTIWVRNEGTTPQVATLNFVHDAQVSFNNASPIANNYVSGTRTATWNLGTIPARGIETIDVYLAVPTNASVGNQLSHYVDLNPIAGDSTPANNVDSCGRVITASYDPNDKQVEPAGEIADDQLLKYTIRFQNTGNDTAFTVMLSDTLDANLDPATYQPGAFSHPYTLKIKGQGILEWTFDNILLPDSNINEPASHGFVVFYMKPKAGLAAGTKIENTAAIYFDYNAPVITNTTESTIEGVLSVDPGAGDSRVQLFPNPSQDLVTVAYEVERKGDVSISVYNLHGQKVHSSGALNRSAGEYRYTFSTKQHNLPEGIYLVKVEANQSSQVKRLVIVK